MLDELEIYSAAKMLGSTKTLEDVRAAIAASEVSRASVTAKHVARVRVDVWDRKSAINGVSADQILSSRTDIPPDGDVYLVYIDGNLILLQPHDPDQAGLVPIPKGKGKERGQQFVNKLIDQWVDEELRREVLKNLL